MQRAEYVDLVRRHLALAVMPAHLLEIVEYQYEINPDTPIAAAQWLWEYVRRTSTIRPGLLCPKDIAQE